MSPLYNWKCVRVNQDPVRTGNLFSCLLFCVGRRLSEKSEQKSLRFFCSFGGNKTQANLGDVSHLVSIQLSWFAFMLQQARFKAITISEICHFQKLLCILKWTFQDLWGTKREGNSDMQNRFLVRKPMKVISNEADV